MIHRWQTIDWSLVIVPGLLILIGLVLIYTITFPTVQFSLAQSQLIALSVGLLAAVFMAVFDYRSWYSLAYIAFALGIALLMVVSLAGSKQFGAIRWIDLGFFQLQPSELMKIILILLLARLLSGWSSAMTLIRLISLLLLAAIPIGLVFVQPDLGTAGVLAAILFGMLLLARLPWKWWLGLIIVGLSLLPLVYFNLQDYQKARLQSFFSPQDDSSGRGYNVRQAEIAIGSGGLIGQGLGRGSQSQLNFLPVAHTDFIFSGLAEAAGLLGSGVLLLLYAILVNRIFKVAALAKDQFGSYTAAGIAIMFACQIVVNIGMNLGLLPITGIPLPMVSFGGSSLIVSLISLGILQSIYSRHKKITF